MEWNYSDCGGDSDIDEDDTSHPPSLSFNAEQTEVVQLLKQTFELPKGLCAQPETFSEFFSMDHLWTELPSDTRQELMAKFLPHFPENDAHEKEETIRRIFHREPFRFNSSPLVDLQKNLEEGNYLTDVVRYRAKMARSERHEQRFQECEHISRVASKLAASRKSLLNLAYNSSYYSPLTCPRVPAPNNISAALNASVAVQARKRYLKEISSITSESNLMLSDSDEEALGFGAHHAINKSSRKAGRPALAPGPDLMTEAGDVKVFSTFSYKPKWNSIPNPPDTCPQNLFNDDYLRSTLRRHKKRKTEDPDMPESPIYDFRMDDVFSAADVVVNKKPAATMTAVKARKPLNSKIKIESTTIPKSSLKRENGPIAMGHLDTSRAESSKSLLVPRNLVPQGGLKDSVVKVKQEPVNNGQPVAKKMKMSPEKVHESAPVGVEVDSERIAEGPSSLTSNRSHACFMSLVRSIFCSTHDHRITFDNLQRAIRVWLLNGGKGQTNDWFSDCHSWLDELVSVVKFLVGEFVEQPVDYVPYVEYKAPLKIYQWIGAGRDTDQHLMPLYRFWLEHRQEFGKSNRTPQLTKVSARSSISANVNSDTNGNTDDVELVALPRCPTTWIIRPERTDEIAMFRVQERQRYERPNSPFTFRMHGYESVVGPVQGVYAQVLNKGLNLLSADRLPSVTLMSLVRDAVARLPNGEGSKAHVCELLKASQFIIQGSGLQVAVNTVIERLLNDADRCVRFDARRKILIYMHRSRSEKDFEAQSSAPTTVAVSPTFKRVGTVKLAKSKTVAETGINSVEHDHRNIVSRGTTMKKMGAAPLMDQMIVVSQPSYSQTAQNVVIVSSPSLNSGGLSPAVVQTSTSSILVNRQQYQQPNTVYKIRASRPPTVIQTGPSPLPSPNSRLILQSGKSTNVIRIQSPNTSGEPKDIEANLDAKHPPALIPKLTYNSKGTVKVATSAGVQTYHVSTLQSASNQQPRPMMSLFTTSQGQSVLMHNQQQRTVKVPTTSQSLLQSSINPPALVSTSTSQTAYVTDVSGKVVPRANSSAVISNVTKLVRARTSPAITAKKSILNHSTLSAKVNPIPRPIQVCTSTGNVSLVESVSTANGSVVRSNAGTSLLASQKPVIQNIVIQSGSPQTRTISPKRGISLKSFSVDAAGNVTGTTNTTMKSILVASPTGDGQNVIKIRTSAPNQLIGTSSSSSVMSGMHAGKTLSTHTPGGTQILHIQPSAGQPQQYILNSVRQAHHANTQVPHTISVKAPIKQTATSQAQIVQLPPKTLLKGSPISARVVKAGSSGSSPQPIVRTVGVPKVMTNAGMGQLVTLVDAGSGKTTHTTPIRIGKAGTTNVIQLSANGAGHGTQYTVVSPGRSMIQMQQGLKADQQGGNQPRVIQQGPIGGRTKTDNVISPMANSKIVAAHEESVANIKPGFRMVNTANMNVTRIGKPILISNKMGGNVTSLIRGATPATKITSTSTSAPTGSTTNLLISGQTLNSSNAAQHLMIGNQLVKIQTSGAGVSPGDRGKSVILNTNTGQTYKVQSLVQNQGKLIKTTVPKGTMVVKSATGLKSNPAAGTPNRVVLVQGSGGQLILPSNLQGGSINLKSLKMISVQPQQQQPPPKQ